MKTAKVLSLYLALALLALDSCTTGPKPVTTREAPPKPTAPASQSNRLTMRIPASDARFRYEGRMDFSDTNAPVIIWQASRISIDFEGSAIQVLFDGAKGQNYFNALVDGSNTIVAAGEGLPASPATFSKLGPGRHHLMLFKRSEAAAGTVHFRGVEVAPPTKVWAPLPPHYELAVAPILLS